MLLPSSVQSLYNPSDTKLHNPSNLLQNKTTFKAIKSLNHATLKNHLISFQTANRIRF